MVDVKPQQANRLTQAYAEIGAVLKELGVIQDAPAPPSDPQWLKDTAKQWGLLNALAIQHNGDASPDEWSRLGRQHGYDPRGLGGFFVGKQPLMGRQGERRVLTEYGRRFIERWRDDFDSKK